MSTLKRRFAECTAGVANPRRACKLGSERVCNPRLVKRHFTCDTTVVENLERFSGKQVEIIIIPFEENGNETFRGPLKSARGRLKRYANPDLIKKEGIAWTMAMKEKHQK